MKEQHTFFISHQLALQGGCGYFSNNFYAEMHANDVYLFLKNYF